MPGGRPTKYRAEYCEIAERVLGEGYSQAVLAGELGVDEDTITAWKQRHPKFLGAIKSGALKGQKMWEGMGMDGARGGIEGFNSASWIFNMKNRFGWRDKQEISGDGGGALQINIVKHGKDKADE